MSRVSQWLIFYSFGYSYDVPSHAASNSKIVVVVNLTLEKRQFDYSTSPKPKEAPIPVAFNLHALSYPTVSPEASNRDDFKTVHSQVMDSFENDLLKSEVFCIGLFSIWGNW